LREAWTRPRNSIRSMRRLDGCMMSLKLVGMMLSIAGLLVLCIVLQGSASLLSSTRGEKGLVVAL
jgi:hypothetical protein